MTYETLKQEVIKEALKDPAGFIIDQFQERKTLHDSRLNIYNLQDNPTIVRMQDRGDIELDFMVWNVPVGYVEKLQVGGHSVESGETLTWERDWIKYYTPRKIEGDPRRICATALTDAVEGWQWLADHWHLNYLPTFAWFFPYGIRGAQRRPNTVLAIDNLATEEEEEE